MNQYQGTFGEGEVGLNAALAANQEVQGNKTKNELHAIPSYELIKSYLPKIKAKLGAGSMSYLAALLQTKLLGLRDNLGGIEIRTDDGGLYDRTVGESSRRDWYNKNSGRLYISHFKTNKSRLGTPYDFALKDIPELKNAIDHTLRPDHPQADRKYLVGVGVNKDGLPASVGEKIIQAFRQAGLVYNSVNKGKLKPTSPGPNTIRHAQIVWKHRDLQRKNPSLTAAQVSDRISGFFNHGSDINQGYLRKTFDSLDDPLARKGGALPTISEDEAGPSRRAPEPKEKPAAMKKAAKKAAAPEAPPPRPAPPPPAIVTGTRRSARGRIPSRRLDLT
jgi:hypothetical protein